MLIYFILGLLVMGLKVWFYYKYRPQKLADWIEWGRNQDPFEIDNEGFSLFMVALCQYVFWPLSMIIIPIIRWIGNELVTVVDIFIENLNKKLKQ